MDTTQVLTDLKQFEWPKNWTEFHHGEEKQDGDYDQPFKKNKTNLPQNYTVPDDLKIYLNAIRSEVSDPRNRTFEECNLPHDELAALKELARLQKDKVIVIKACVTGAGIIILNYTDYMKACYSHLSSYQAENKPY